MVQACESRYQKLLELSRPFDESDVEGVVDGLTKLTELLTEEVVADHRYFRRPFEMELDIVRLTAQTYLQRFVADMDSHSDLLCSDDVIKVASKGVFALFKRLKKMEQKLKQYVTNLEAIRGYEGYKVEKWFAPFVFKWLDHLLTKTVSWVTSAVKADNFDPPAGERDQDGIPPHSSSVTDLFSAVYSELEFIIDMGWTNEVQNAGFFQKFAKTVNKAIEQYCDAIGTEEVIKPEGSISSSFTSLLHSRNQSGTGVPVDISRESCVKLCNLEYALGRLDDMYKLMNVSVLTRAMRDYRATLAPARNRSVVTERPLAGVGSDAGDEGMRGAFRFQISYAENLKPVTSAGLANAYVVLRVPEGTVVPPPDPDDLTAGGGSAGGILSNVVGPAPNKPLTLIGTLCELARTRAIPDSLNPTWDETFMTLLPPVPRVEVFVLSRNLVMSGELCGSGAIDLGPSGRLRSRLADHQTHDVAVELEPQGRLLVRITLEGEEEDIDFWFRKSRERLGRMQDDLLRSLCAKISPYMKEVLTKAVDEHEAAPLRLGARNFLPSFMGGTAQYSNVTVAGASVDQRLTDDESEAQLAPLHDYLDRNLSLLAESMSSHMAQSVIRRTWDEALAILERLLVPPLHGSLEKTRRPLNPRQLSAADLAQRSLLSFFHADGDGLGIPLQTLESRRWRALVALIAAYHAPLADLRRDCELAADAGASYRDKDLLLRLVRLRYERQDDLTPVDREEGRKWLDAQLARRREKRAA
ncbi:hypothetical protein HK405_010026 [Cladochytrium tenue]|nr:hypothetical protein HK405_010026 [Cladochytrium tenue]